MPACPADAWPPLMPSNRVLHLPRSTRRPSPPRAGTASCSCSTASRGASPCGRPPSAKASRWEYGDKLGERRGAVGNHASLRRWHQPALPNLALFLSQVRSFSQEHGLGNPAAGLFVWVENPEE